jgi:hypothetical protein
MSMASLEREILSATRIVSGRMNLRKKDIAEWTTGDIAPSKDETVFYLPTLGINVAVYNIAL